MEKLIAGDKVILVLMLHLINSNFKLKRFYLMFKAFTKIGVFVDLPFFFQKLESEAYVQLYEKTSKLELGQYEMTDKGRKLLDAMPIKELVKYLELFEEFNLEGFQFFIKEKDAS